MYKHAELRFPIQAARSSGQIEAKPVLGSSRNEPAAAASLRKSRRLGRLGRPGYKKLLSFALRSP